MSVESLAIALHHSKTSGTAKLVLIGIANHDGDGGAWPSVRTLAKYAGVTERNVQKAISLLVSKGELYVYAQAGGTRAMPDHRRPNRYEIALKCPANCDRTMHHRLVDNFTKTVVHIPLSEPTPGVGSDTPPPVGSDTRTIIKNHPLNPSFEPHSPAIRETCRACGQHNDSKTKFCTKCSSRGLDSDIINCRHCNLTTRRKLHGQQWFYCPEHAHLKGND